jgi:hypothetical protein
VAATRVVAERRFKTFFLKVQTGRWKLMWPFL